jgi:hypothetical protein
MDRFQLADAARRIGEMARQPMPAGAGPEEAAAWKEYCRTLADVQKQLEAAGRSASAVGPARPAATRPPAAALRPTAQIRRPAASRPSVAGRGPGATQSAADQMQLMQLQLQNAMNRQSQFLAKMSYIMKEMHDTAMEIIGNLK